MLDDLPHIPAPNRFPGRIGKLFAASHGMVGCLGFASHISGLDGMRRSSLSDQVAYLTRNPSGKQSVATPMCVARRRDEHLTLNALAAIV